MESTYARVVNGVVTNVIVAEASFFDTFVDPDPTAQWIQTFMDGSQRKNYAGIGFTYDAGLDAFIPPKPFPSWVLDSNKGNWVAPVAKPSDGKFYAWDEASTSWVEVTLPIPPFPAP